MTDPTGPSSAATVPGDTQLPRTATDSRLDVLDVWRGVACLMVFTWHTGLMPRKPPLALFGCTGVQLFFVLSGYLIYQPFARAMVTGHVLPPFAQFYARRFLRIYPAYAVALVVFVLLRFISGVQPPDLFNVVTHFLLVFNYCPSINLFSINSVFWSLAIEIQFYAILPLACIIAVKLLPRRGALAAVLLPMTFIAVGIVARALERHVTYPFGFNYQSIFSFLDLFGMGMLVGCWRHRRGALCPRARWVVFFVGLVLFIAANDWYAVQGDWFIGGGNRFYVLMFPLPLCAGAALMLSALVLREDAVTLLPGMGLLRRVGVISYSVYLYHVGVQFVIMRAISLDRFTYNQMALGYALLSLVPTLVLSWMMYRLVEEPTLKMAARIKTRKQFQLRAVDAAPARDATFGPVVASE